MVSQRIRIGLFGCALATGTVLLLLFYHPRLAPIREAIFALRSHSQLTGGAKAAAPAASVAASEDRSHLADGLNSPSGDVHADLRLVNEIFIAYRGATRAEDPVGENVEITAALTGRNRLHFAFIPSDCAAINSKGELCDRWGTPYFFHQLSGQKMEIRSAGPDRRLWTADDEVLTP
jgi:hypothetical protein